MKKSIKKSLTALVAVPVAAALFAGCGLGEVKSSLDENPYTMPARTYSTETAVASDTAFAGGVTAPTLTSSDTAYVSSVTNNKDGSKVIVMENVSEADYLEYEASHEQAAVSTVADPTYDVEFVADESDPTIGTMIINYSTGVELADPADFRLLNLATGASENLYMKMVLDSSVMYNFYLEMAMAFPNGYDELNEEYTYPTREEAILMLAAQGLTEENCGMAIELATRGEDFAFGIYNSELSAMAAKVGSFMYVTQKGPEYLIYEDTESEAIAQVWYKELYTEGAESGAVGGSMDDYDSLAGGYNLTELQSMYLSTGYETINGKVYYYEEFNIPDEEETEPDLGGGESFTTEGSEDSDAPTYTTVRYYFNGNDLVYVSSDGMLMEVLISNSIPARLFSTECPTGYLDYTGRVED